MTSIFAAKGISLDENDEAASMAGAEILNLCQTLVRLMMHYSLAFFASLPDFSEFLTRLSNLGVFLLESTLQAANR